MITIKDIALKNFMSIGNVTQSVSFNKGSLTLVLGENLDLGGAGSKNGVGKSVLVNGLSYALYGAPLVNIKTANLINKINGKTLVAKVTFDKNGIEYVIERGRSPTFLKFFINGKEQKPVDESQGESKDTQKSIDELLGMKHELFKHIVALNTYTIPFLAMKPGEQRDIIEQLLGITLLSEKADSLKLLIKASKDAIASEGARIDAVNSANVRIQESIDSLHRRQKVWNDNKESTISSLTDAINSLNTVDIDKEITAQRAAIEWNTTKKDLVLLTNELATLDASIVREDRHITQINNEITQLRNKKCPSCEQELQGHVHDTLLVDKNQQYEDSCKVMNSLISNRDQVWDTINEIKEIGVCPSKWYDNLEQALSHKNTIDGLEKDLLSKTNEVNPYTDQISELTTTALQEISWDFMNDLVRHKEHQDFLLKLLTNKDSFVRKRIIDQNLTFLNQRLSYYLSNLGLPHLVEFENDLTVSITQLGQDLDFHNLSRGEMNRLILSLSWAFRDVWENLYQPINLMFIDELIDSGLDAAGVESSITVLKQMARDRHRNIFLISHRDDLTSRVNTVLKVIKENGFTSYAPDVEIE